MEISGNKGEWSEVYALFKLLSDKELSAGDADLNKVEKLIYPIIRIIRYDLSGEIRYNYSERNVIIKSGNDHIIGTIPVLEFKKQAKILLTKIQQGKGRAFEIPEITQFRTESFTNSIKAPSGKKADITIVVHDERVGIDPTLSFSIKSQLGNPATLLNSGENTNFIFELSKNLDDESFKNINSVSSESKRISLIIGEGISLHFRGIEPSTQRGNMYYCNLMNIDSFMPEILAQFILIALENQLTSVSDIVAKMTELNPLGFDFTYKHPYYETKMKRLFVDSALGMTPSVMWNGKYEANGGYIVVRQDGEIVCYHIYNKNEFEDYLFNNLKIDYPSRSRYNYGDVYSLGAKQYVKLNCQIRFKK